MIEQPQISSKFSQTFSLRHVSRVGSVVNIALFQIVNDILVLLALDGKVAKMDEMRGKFFAEICGAIVVNVKRRDISCMFCFKRVTMTQIILSRLTMVEVLFLKVRLVVWLLW